MTIKDYLLCLGLGALIAISTTFLLHSCGVSYLDSFERAALFSPLNEESAQDGWCEQFANPSRMLQREAHKMRAYGNVDVRRQIDEMIEYCRSGGE